MCGTFVDEHRMKKLTIWKLKLSTDTLILTMAGIKSGRVLIKRKEMKE